MKKEIQLTAYIREKEKPNQIRKEGFIPAVLYGPKIENKNLKIDQKEFRKVFKEAGESSLVELKIEGEKENYLVLIHDFQRDPISGDFVHIDFYQPDLEKEVEAWVPIVTVGEAPAVKQLGGTLVKNVTEVLVRALPLKLPHEIKVDISSLETFDDEILTKDLKVGEGVKIMKDPDDVIISVSPPEKVEEELAKPEEETVEPEVIGEKKKEESPQQEESSSESEKE